MTYIICMRGSPILRLSLRQQVYSSLFTMLLDGRWHENSRINDSALAAELSVSRTPVREALIQLETEGLLACDPNRGFFLPPLRPEEARDLYPILWSLEQLAVFLSAGDTEQLRKRLDQVDQAGSRAGASADPAAALKRDRAWHAALVEAGGNARLVELARRTEALSRRYAATLPRDSSSAERRDRDHAQIAEALATDQPARAFALLKMHWRAEMDEVLHVLDQRAAKSAPDVPSEKPHGARRSRAAAAGKS